MHKLLLQRGLSMTLTSQRTRTLPTTGLLRWCSSRPDVGVASAAVGDTVPPEDKSSGGGLGVTEACAKRLSELVGGSGSSFLRVSVEGGGCSGFQYKFLIDDQIGPEDRTFGHPAYSSARVVVDPTSLEYLEGATVDYQKELIRSAFRILANPKADHGCSCGASFTIKL